MKVSAAVGGTISVEELARVRAALDAGEDEGAALARLGADASTWSDQEKRLLEELDEECERGDFQRIQAYQAAYQVASGRTPTPAPEALAETAPIATTAHVPAAPHRELASFQRAATPRAATSPSNVVADDTLDERTGRQPTVPFVVGPASPAPSAAPVSRIPTGTADFDIRAFGLASTPFAQPSSATGSGAATPAPPILQSPSFAPAAPPAPAAGLPKTTMFVSEHSATPRPEALPFQASAPGALNIGVPRSVTPAPSPPAASRNPFPPPASEVAAASRTAIAFTQPPDSKAAGKDALPFLSADQLMPIERYAEITALLLQEGSPEKTFARLGLDPTAWMTTVRSYAKRFAADPLMEKTFDVLVKRAQRNAR